MDEFFGVRFLTNQNLEIIKEVIDKFGAVCSVGLQVAWGEE